MRRSCFILPTVIAGIAIMLGGCPADDWNDGDANEPQGVDNGQPAPEPGTTGQGLAITATVPVDRATNVSRTARLEVHFNRAVNPESVQGYIRPQIDMDISSLSDGRRLLLAPVAPLEADTTYSLTVESIQDTSGNRLARPVSICFSTGPTLGDCPTAVACQPPNATDPHVPEYTAYAYTRPFAADSAWNTPIGPNPEIDPASANLVSRMEQVRGQNGLWLGFDQYTPSIFFVDDATPSTQVRVTSPFWTGDRTPSVAIPAYALPGCGDDNLMIVVHTRTQQAIEFWQAAPQSDGTWTTSWMAEYTLSGSGVDAGIRAARFPLAAGLIWPHELAGGRIDHAIEFSYSFVRSGVLTAPATATDGAFDDPAALPMGARIQLDPALNLDTLGLTAHERTIARALQEYGMILGDSAGSIALTLVHPYSFAGNPYQGLLPDSVTVEGGTLLDRIPVDRFRVLKINVQVAP